MKHTTANQPLVHGGDLISASKASGIPLENWLDLSTGISPYAYPINSLPADAFTKLPYIDRSFIKSVKTYYGSDDFVALPGTQTAIHLLPNLLSKLPVLLPDIGYQEHAQAWQKSGNTLDYYSAMDKKTAHQEIELKLNQNSGQHLVIINPNNPSTLCFTPQQLILWATKLENDAYLIIDEAFIDSSPQMSLIPYLSNNVTNNIIVLRSFGKFFGLAGIRLGFMFASEDKLGLVEAHLPLWSVNGPALHLATLALNDAQWQTDHQNKLVESEQLTRTLFEALAYHSCAHQRLFSSYTFPKKLALIIFECFYLEGILLRLIELSEDLSIIRIGRIKVEDQTAQHRIRSVLDKLARTIHL